MEIFKKTEYQKYLNEEQRKKGESSKNCMWTRDEMIELYHEQNLKPIQIGKLHNPQVSDVTIRKWIDIFGIEKKTLLAEDGQSLKSKYNKREISVTEYQKYLIEEKKKKGLNENEIKEKEELKKLYIDEDMSIRKICKIYKCTWHTIERKLKIYGIDIKSYRIFSVDELKKLYIDEKMSAINISKIYKCSRGIIDKKLREYNIPIRIQGSFLVDDDGKTLHSKKLKNEISDKKYNDEYAKSKGHKNHSEYKKYLTEEKRENNESPINCMWIKDEMIILYHEQNLSPIQIGKLHDPPVSSATIINWIYIFGIEKKTWFEIQGGKKNHWWKGGITDNLYTIEFTYEVREQVREYWFRNCVLCGFPEENHGIKLSVHHVDYNKNQNGTSIEWKLVSLCNNCHSLTNNNRNYYEYLFTNFIKIRKILEDFEWKIDYKSIGTIG